jgi:uncharacterized protein YndB with AHSA1/START domain
MKEAVVTEPTVIHSTFVIERSFDLSPEKIFAAFSEPSAKRRWYADGGGHEVTDFELDFREGGFERSRYRMGDKTPMPGAEMGSDVVYDDIQPNRRIVFSQTMSMAGRRFSAALITFEFLERDGGTTLVCTHQGAFFEHADGPQMREHGWQTLLDRLGRALAA